MQLITTWESGYLDFFVCVFFCLQLCYFPVMVIEFQLTNWKVLYFPYPAFKLGTSILYTTTRL